MGKSTLKKSYIVGLALVIVIVFLTIIFRGAFTVSLDVPESVLSDGWKVVLNGEEMTIHDYPSRLNVDKGETYTIYKTLPATDDQLYMLIYAERQDITVTVDDHIIFQHTQEINSFSFYANLYHIVEIDQHDSEDVVVEITYHSPYLRSAGLIAPIYETTASPSALYTTIFSQQIGSFVLGGLILIIGLMTLIVSSIADQMHTESKYYAAIFGILFGLWIVARSTLLQFVTNNAYILGGLQVTIFLVLFIPLLMFYKTSITKRYQTQTLMLVGFYGLQSIIVTILQVTGLIDFYAPVLFVSITTIIGMIIVLAFVVLDVLHEEKRAKKFSHYYGILFLYSLITFINEQTLNDYDLATYGLIVLGVLALVIFIDYITYIERRLKLSNLSEDYAKLAYMDRLTGAKNRHAYEEDIERLFKNESIRKHLRLVFFDFDGLKQINDQYGHVEGDFALKEGFIRIKEAFGRYGECYRIGGDEFACIIQSLDDQLYHDCHQKLIDEVKTFSAYHKYDLGISIGTSIYQEMDKHPNDMIVRADMNMYVNKKSKK